MNANGILASATALAAIMAAFGGSSIQIVVAISATGVVTALTGVINAIKESK